VAIGSAPKRPWVGALWAQSRVEHLQEELALNAAQPELKNEILELALAYNFVTPYTAFLAIPESELGEMRGTVEAARAHKAKIMADNRDAADLRDQNGSKIASKPDVDVASSSKKGKSRRFAGREGPDDRVGADASDDTPSKKGRFSRSDDDD